MKSALWLGGGVAVAVVGGVYNCQSRWSETVQLTARVDKWRQADETQIR